jgi:hypothetical protein
LLCKRFQGKKKCKKKGCLAVPREREKRKRKRKRKKAGVK